MTVEEVIEQTQEFSIEVEPNPLGLINGPEAYNFLYLNSGLMLIVITMSNSLSFELAAMPDKRGETEEPFTSLLWPTDRPIDSDGVCCQIEPSQLTEIVKERDFFKLLNVLRRMLS